MKLMWLVLTAVISLCLMGVYGDGHNRRSVHDGRNDRRQRRLNKQRRQALRRQARQRAMVTIHPITIELTPNDEDNEIDDSLENDNSTVEIDYNMTFHGNHSRHSQQINPRIWQWRERSKRFRIFMIQTQILQRLGLTRQPNISNVIPPDRLLHLRRIYSQMRPDQERVLYNHDNLKMYQCLAPSCDLPRKSDRSWVDETTFRLYFVIEPPVHGLTRRELNVSSATLRLFKRPYPPEEGTTDCNCDGPTTRHRRSHVPETTRSPGETNAPPVEEFEEEDTDMIRLLAYRYKKPVRRNKRGSSEMVAWTEIARKHEGWIKLDIKKAVTSWFKKPRKNFGLRIQVEDSEGNQLDPFLFLNGYNCSEDTNHTLTLPLPFALSDGQHSLNDTQLFDANITHPTLDITTVEYVRATSARQKRDIITRKSCVREKVYVSFSDMGWNDWLIQPQGFEAGFCKGTCSPMGGNKTWKSRYFQRRMATQSECCGPIKLKSLSVLYYDKDSKLRISVLDDFIVSECGCRP